jgi:hypothetical protein
MTPKEKAEELVDKFSFSCRECDNSKQCAMIAVDEIIEVLWKTNKNETEYRHWQQVKKEIEEL